MEHSLSTTDKFCTDESTVLFATRRRYSIPTTKIFAYFLDIEGAAVDTSRLTGLLPEAQTPAIRMLVFRPSFLFLPASPVASNAFKQCLH
ncbi:hypothetical protein B0H12DRAFT_1246334 [Mycena haematopus]|nr:hypothetical protein B0H12DRAFT_1246334 [Mycena haematopus]